MINSISNNQEYQYQTSISKTATSSAAAEFAEKMASSSQEETKEVTESTATQEYTMEEFLEMLRNGKFMSLGTETEEEEDSEADTESISDEEAVTAFFEQYDVNEDGVISMDEMPTPGEKPENMGKMPPPPKTQQTEETAEDLFQTYDTDGDGQLSEAEFSAMMEALKPDNEVAQETATDEEALTTETDTDTEKVSATAASYEKMILQALQAYMNNYESMFESTDGTLLSNQA